MNKKVMEKAKKIWGEDLDLIIDLYDLTIQYDSPRHLKRSKRTKEEVVGKNLKEFVSGSTKLDVDQVLGQFIIKGKVKFDVEIITTEGKKLKECVHGKMFTQELTPYAAIKMELI